MVITQVELQEQIIQNLQVLPKEQLQKVFEFVQSLQANALFAQWDNLSDAEAQALQTEFAQEDINFSEGILADSWLSLNKIYED